MDLLTAALIAAAAAATASPAARAGVPASVVVHGDLDLTRPADMARLRRRIALAVEEVCGSYAAIEPYQEQELSRCRAETLREAETALARVAVARSHWAARPKRR